MKWNNKIRDKNASTIATEYIYDYDRAKDLFKEVRRYRQLSLMKQENILMAIQEGIKQEVIGEALIINCGYCFIWRNRCEGCPLTKRNDGIRCVNSTGYNNISSAMTIEEFAEAHEKWCRKLGLWEEDWE